MSIPQVLAIDLNYGIDKSELEKNTKDAFIDWTKSEAFRLAHKNAGQHKDLYIGAPNFEGFEVVI